MSVECTVCTCFGVYFFLCLQDLRGSCLLLDPKTPLPVHASVSSGQQLEASA